MKENELMSEIKKNMKRRKKDETIPIGNIHHCKSPVDVLKTKIILIDKV